MVIKVLEVRADGTQEIVEREMPDNWFDATESPPVPPDPLAALDALAVEHELRITLLELGV